MKSNWLLKSGTYYLSNPTKCITISDSQYFWYFYVSQHLTFLLAINLIRSSKYKYYDPNLSFISGSNCLISCILFKKTSLVFLIMSFIAFHFNNVLYFFLFVSFYSIWYSFFLNFRMIPTNLANLLAQQELPVPLLHANDFEKNLWS